jgi:hypothetical protein
MDEAQNNRSDHDLLIRLDTKMDRAADDIKSLGHRVEEVRHDVGIMADSLEVKIAAAVSGKADTQTVLDLKNSADKLHDDHERRIRILERYVWTAIGALAIVQTLVAFFK